MYHPSLHFNFYYSVLFFQQYKIIIKFFFNFSLNYCSNGSIIIIILISKIIIINLNFINLKNYCLLLNLLLILLTCIIFISINLILFHFIFESSLLSISYTIIKCGYGQFRFDSSFHLISYTLVFSLPLLYCGKLDSRCKR